MNRTAGLPASAWHPHIHRRKKSTRRAWGLASWPPPMGGVGGWVGLSWYACGIFSSARRRTSTSVWPMCTPHTTLRCVPRRTRKAEGRVAGRGRGVWWGWVGRRGEKGQLKQPHAPPPPLPRSLPCQAHPRRGLRLAVGPHTRHRRVVAVPCACDVCMREPGRRVVEWFTKASVSKAKAGERNNKGQNRTKSICVCGCLVSFLKLLAPYM